MTLRDLRLLLYFGCLFYCVAMLASDEESPITLALPLGVAGGVLSVSLSSNSRFLLTTDLEGSAIVWEAATGAEIRKFRRQASAIVEGAIVLDDGSVLMEDDEDHIVRRDLGYGRIQQVFASGHRFVAFAFSASVGLVTAEPHGIIRRWDLKTGSQSEPIPIGCDDVSALDVSSDGKYLGVICEHPVVSRKKAIAQSVRIWNVAANRIAWGESMPGESSTDLMDVLHGNTSDWQFRKVVRFVGNYVFVGATTSTVNQVKTGRQLSLMRSLSPDLQDTLFGAPGALQVVTTKSGERLACLGVAYLWDAVSGESVGVMAAPDVRPPIVMFSTDLSIIYHANSIEKSIDIYNVETGRWQGGFRGTVLPIRAIGVPSTGDNIVTNSFASLRIWNLAKGQETHRLLDGTAYTHIAVSADGAYVFARVTSPNSVPQLRKISLVTGAVEKSYSLADVEFGSDLFELAPDATAFVVGRHGRYVIYDCETGRELGLTFNGGPKYATGLVLSNRATELFVFGTTEDLTHPYDSPGTLWNTTTASTIDITFRSTFGNWTFSSDGRYLAATDPRGVVSSWVAADGSSRKSTVPAFNTLGEAHPIRFSPRGDLLLAAFGNSAFLLDSATLTSAGPHYSQDTTVTALGFMPDEETMLTAGEDGTVRFWSRPGEELVAMVALDDSQQWDAAFGSPFRPQGTDTNSVTGRSRWITFDRDGHFDTRNFDDARDVHWVVKSAPYPPLPLEALIKTNFEPNLLQRRLSREPIVAAKQDTPKSFSRPTVRIADVEYDDPKKESVSISVAVASTAIEFQSDGRSEALDSGVQDLRIFRNQQLVREYFFPENGRAEGAADTLGSPDCREVKQYRERLIVCAHIKLPPPAEPKAVLDHNHRPSNIQFSGYAFSRSGIKSDTSLFLFRDSRSPTRQRTSNAYVISIGVSANDNCQLDIRDAAADASLMASTLTRELAKTSQFKRVVPLVLTSESVDDCLGNRRDSTAAKITVKDATKSNIEGVFAVLGGANVRLARRLRCGTNSIFKCGNRLQASKPNDVIIIFFSGHGERDVMGQFYLVTADSGKVESLRDNSGEVNSSILKHSISTADLAVWIRDVDAASVSLIIDACHSAAAVGSETFKPGPMGSRDLGELAFGKGIRILAATQSAGLAVDESLHLKHGLLAYAIVHDGIEQKRAKPSNIAGDITISDLFEYAAQDVPDLYRQYVQGSEIQYPKIYDFQPDSVSPVVLFNPKM